MEDERTSANFPPAEFVTRRLKKILLLADKVPVIDFENVGIPERTGLTLLEKQAACKILSDIGLEGAQLG